MNYLEKNMDDFMDEGFWSFTIIYHYKMEA